MLLNLAVFTEFAVQCEQRDIDPQRPRIFHRERTIEQHAVNLVPRPAQSLRGVLAGLN